MPISRSFAIRALVCTLTFAACKDEDPPDTVDAVAYPDVPQSDSVADSGDSDTGPEILGFGGDVPVVIDWILPLPGAVSSGAPGLYIHDMAVGPDGSVVLAGERFGTGDVDPGPGELIISSPTNRPALTRFDKDGKLAWALIWSAPFGIAKTFQVAIGADGTIYFAGMLVVEANAPVDFDPGPATDSIQSRGFQHIFVARFDPAGHYLGTWTSSGDGTVVLASIVPGPTGDLWLTGFITGHPDLDPTSATHVLHSQAGLPSEGLVTAQVPFVAKWTSTGQWVWGRVPELAGVGRIEPLPDGGAMMSGVVGGGATLADVKLSDLDPGPGIDQPPIGCLIGTPNGPCQPQPFWMRVDAEGIPSWSFLFNQVEPTRRGATPSWVAGAHAVSPDGSGIIVGTWLTSVDFDWGPAKTVYDTPNHPTTDDFDLFGASFTAAGKFRHVTPIRTLRGTDVLGSGRVTGLGWSGRDKTYHASGWMSGSLATPDAVIGGHGRPLEGWVGGFDALGRPRWAAALGHGVGLGGDDAPRVGTATNGSSVLLASFAGTADLDFTSGVYSATATGARGYYLLAFHEAPCATGDTRECDCTYQPDLALTTTCEPEAPIFAACDCVVTGPRLDGTWPPPPVADCAPCADGWTCDPVTWLCTSDARDDLVTGLDHPLEALDDGTNLYYVVEGHYRRFAPYEARDDRLVRVAKDGSGTPLELAVGLPAHLVTHGGYVYWANGGLFRTASGGDGSVEVVAADPSLVGPLVVDDDGSFVATNIAGVVTFIRKDTGTAIMWPTGAGFVRRMVSDASNVYALCDGGLYRLSKAQWGVGTWERIAPAFDGQGLVDMGDALVFTEAGAGGQLRRTRKDTWETAVVVGLVASDIRGPAARSGDWVYFSRFGITSAWTWTSEVYRARISDGTLELVASSLVHAVGVTVRDGRVLVVEHGETRVSTALGAIIAFPEPP